MLQREDFFSVFFPAVETYFREACGENVRFSFTDSEKKCNMVIKPHLSAASAIHISAKARSFYYSEWNIRNSILKNIIAKTYVFFATRTGSRFAQFRFSLEPEPANLRDLIIAPNNRSIRVFDYGANVVGCIIKDGFTDRFFQNQLQFRKQHSYDFILPLIASGEKWFQEPILHGHPLARITDNKLYEKSLKTAAAHLAVLATDTLIYVDISDYVSSLSEKIQRLLARAISEKQIETGEETTVVVANAVNLCSKKDGKVPTVTSHGDFQSGNIWVEDSGKVWLYDWETADRRSAWYDASVLAYSLRRYHGWELLMHTQDPVEMWMCIPEQKCNMDYGTMKAIVLLEDLIFYLEDMLELPLKWGSELYDAYIRRLMQIPEIYNGE